VATIQLADLGGERVGDAHKGQLCNVHELEHRNARSNVSCHRDRIHRDPPPKEPLALQQVRQRCLPCIGAFSNLSSILTVVTLLQLPSDNSRRQRGGRFIVWRHFYMCGALRMTRRVD